MTIISWFIIPRSRVLCAMWGIWYQPGWTSIIVQSGFWILLYARRRICYCIKNLWQKIVKCFGIIQVVYILFFLITGCSVGCDIILQCHMTSHMKILYRLAHVPPSPTPIGNLVLLREAILDCDIDKIYTGTKYVRNWHYQISNGRSFSNMPFDYCDKMNEKVPSNMRVQATG